MADQWFYARGGQQSGPVTFTELLALAQTGGLTAADLVWQDGTPDWRPAGQVAGLFAQPAAAPPGHLPPAHPPAPGMPYPGPGGIPPGAYGQSYGQSYAQSYANEARTAMILAIVGIFCLGIVLGPMGIVMGSSAKRKMRASGNMEGEGMATAAIVIGWIIVGMMILGILLVILSVALAPRS